MDENEKSDCHVPEFPAGTAESAYPRLSAPASLETELIVSRGLLDETLKELQGRSDGWRESAALLCGRVVGSQWIAETVKFNHQVFHDRGRPRSIHLTEAAKFQLYEELNSLHLRLIAGIHTHPEDWVDLS